MNTIDTFLATWKQRNLEIYLELLEEFEVLRAERIRLMDKYELHCHRPGVEMPIDYIESGDKLKKFTESLSKQTMSFIWDAKRFKGTAESWFSDKLDKEVKSKKEKLVVRIEKKAGKIIDTELLFIGDDGNINGYVTGDIKKVTVRTILAGGYDIQCLHYRVLVK